MSEKKLKAKIKKLESEKAMLFDVIEFHNALCKESGQPGWVININEEKRTPKQNRSLHLYFTNLATTLNNGGLDVMKTLRHDIAIPWNDELIKELMWRRVQKTTTNKKSTTKLSTKEVTEIYDIINRHLSQTFGVSVPFPNIYDLSREGE
jgi:hypothetical protein